MTDGREHERPETPVTEKTPKADAHGHATIPRAPGDDFRSPETARLDAGSGRRRAAWTLAAAGAAAAVVGVAWRQGGYSVESRSILTVVVWWTVLLAAVLGLGRVRRTSLAAVSVWLLLLAYTAWIAASASWGASAEDAWTEAGRAALYLGVLTLAVIASPRLDARAFVLLLAGAVVAVCVIALTSRLAPGLFAGAELHEFLPSATGRLSYPLGYWNGLGTLAALGAPLLLGVASSERAPALRAASVGAFPLLAATMYLTSSRGGFAVACVCVACFLVLTSRRWVAAGATAIGLVGAAAAIWYVHARPALAVESADAPSGAGQAALVLAVVALLTAFAYAGLVAVAPAVWTPPAWLGGGLIGALAGSVLTAVALSNPAARFEDFKAPPADDGSVSGHLLSSSGSQRWQLWSSAVDQWREEPLHGMGAGTFDSWWTSSQSRTSFVLDAHSLYLESAGELGAVGFSLIAGATVLALVAAVRRVRRAGRDWRVALAALTSVFAGFAVAAAEDWVWELPVIPIVAFACLGLVLALRLPPRDPELSPWRPPATAARIALASVAAVFVLSATLSLLTELQLQRSRSAFSGGDVAAALAAAARARDLAPWTASPRLQLALALEEAGALSAARRAIEQALERDERDWRLWLVASRLQTKLGDIQAARASARRSVDLNPLSPLFARAEPGG